MRQQNAQANQSTKEINFYINYKIKWYTRSAVDTFHFKIIKIYTHTYTATPIYKIKLTEKDHKTKVHCELSLLACQYIISHWNETSNI